VLVPWKIPLGEIFLKLKVEAYRLIITSSHERLHRFADLYLEGTQSNVGGENVTVLNKIKDEICLLPFNNIQPSLVIVVR
jgi:hypothetical protein